MNFSFITANYEEMKNQFSSAMPYSKKRKPIRMNSPHYLLKKPKISSGSRVKVSKLRSNSPSMTEIVLSKRIPSASEIFSSKIIPKEMKKKGNSISSFDYSPKNTFSSETIESVDNLELKELEKFNEKKFVNFKASKIKTEIQFSDLKNIIYSYEFNVHFMEMGSFSAEDRIEMLDWIMDISHRMGLSRETFFLACYYIDRFIAEIKHLQKDRNKLLAITSLYVASKTQEIYPPKPSQFFLAMKYLFHMSKVYEFEIYLISSLKFRMTPPTINYLVNYFVYKWDSFLTEKVKIMTNEFSFLNEDQDSYKNYRNLVNMLDFLVLDIKILKLDKIRLALSLICITIIRNSTIVNITISEKQLKSIFSELKILRNFKVFLSYFNYKLEDLTGIIVELIKDWEIEPDYLLPIALEDKLKKNKIESWNVALDHQSHNDLYKSIQLKKLKILNKNS